LRPGRLFWAGWLAQPSLRGRIRGAGTAPGTVVGGLARHCRADCPVGCGTGRSSRLGLATDRAVIVISSPISGVFAVIAAGRGPRRGHVICSGVFAVCSRCSSRRCPGPLPGLPGRVPLRRLELADQLPVGAWCCRAADGSALEPGELSVPGDRRGPDCPDATMGRGSVAGGKAPWRRLSCPPPRRHKRLAGGSIPSCAGISACGPERFIRGQVACRLGLQRVHHHRPRVFAVSLVPRPG
jgi:hypothetical protein